MFLAFIDQRRALEIGMLQKIGEEKIHIRRD